jgi:hypothetical protein
MKVDLDCPIEILAKYISEYHPWLATHPALVALLVVAVPILLFTLVSILVE